ncbi:MAG: hypothetical protein J7641_20365 [Cyanobacteria bacterium SID2]|nr:hypothetical protein [Cyanobacteria bacterium SID2]
MSDITPTNEKALEELIWSIEASQGKFLLVLAQCNDIQTRDRLLQHLSQMCSFRLRSIELPPGTTQPYSTLCKILGDDRPDALMVLGLVGSNREALVSIDNMREAFRETFQFPVIFWITRETHVALIRVAPDFESWTTTTKFESSASEFVALVRDIANCWFSLSDAEPAVSYFDVGDEIDRFFRSELASSVEEDTGGELGSPPRAVRSDGEFAANCASLLGLSLSLKSQWLRSIEQLETAFDRWGQLNQIDRQGLVLTEIAFCVKKLASQNEVDRVEYCFDRALNLFDKIENFRIYNKLVDRVYRMVRSIEAWDKQEVLARKVLEIGKTAIDRAKAYSFLGEACRKREQWQDARDFAFQSLELLKTIEVSASDSAYNVEVRGFLENLDRCTLGTALDRLEESNEALTHLETAKQQSNPELDLTLHLDILCELERIYYHRKAYLQAFETKQERLSIEQQFGLIAFVGAGRVQPRRTEIRSLTPNRLDVADEIAASGRQQDVEKLLERVGRIDTKITLVYGFSGVGKSSLISAGLVPAIQRKSFGVQDGLVVLLRNYNDWQKQFAIVLTKTLHEKEIDPYAILDSEDAILTQLQHNEDTHNLRTVLIFDQFEEFFFEYGRKRTRNVLFDFLGRVLDTVSSLRVIFSLRRDSIHFLLRRTIFQDIDILSDKNLYYIGNFTPEEAKTAVEQLSRQGNFPMQPDLIDAVIADLSKSETSEKYDRVRPIELQIVGAQLQRENITTLEEYRQKGTKEELVGRYVDEAVRDCGTENRQLAELVLFLLTDEKILRPTKNRSELAEEVTQLNTPTDELDLVLMVLAGSGLLVRLPSQEEDGYQLIHDYLAELIRQQQEPRVMELVKQEREKREKAEAQLADAEVKNRKATQRLQIGSILLAVSVLAALGLGAASEVARQGLKRRKLETRLEQQANDAVQRFEFDQIEALLVAIRAVKELQKTEKNGVYVVYRPISALGSIVRSIREQNRLQGHQNRVWSAQFSLGGEHIITASDDGTARLWDTQGNELSVFEGHQGTVWGVQFNPNGERIVTASDDGTARLWDTQGNELAVLEGHQEAVVSVRFSPNGERIVTASEDGTARLWDTQGNELSVLEGHQGKVWSAQFSPNGERIVTASDDGTARLWDAQGQVLVVLKGHQEAVGRVQFSPDGERIVTTSSDGTARLWDSRGYELAILKGHQGTVWSTQFSPDGERIVTASEDGTARLWDAQGHELAVFKGHIARVVSVRFSPDGKRIVTASYDDTARLWDVQGNELAVLEGHQEAVWSAQFSPDGEQIVTASFDDTVRLWDFQGHELAVLEGHQEAVWSAQFSPDGEQIVTASYDGTARLWDVQGNELAVLEGHQEEVISAQFSPEGKRIVTVSYDGTARLWDVQGNELAVLEGHQGAVRSAQFSPDGERIVTASYDGMARLWDVQGNELAVLEGHQEEVISAQFSLEGKRIVTASIDNTARLWDVQGNELAVLEGHQGAVWSAQFSPDGERIVTASYDGTARLWDVQGNELAVLEGHQGTVWSAQFSPDGECIVTASTDKTARLWDTQGIELAVFEGHRNSVVSVRFSPDGEHIVTASTDKTARLWDTQGHELGILEGHQDKVWSAQFSPDGEHIVTASSDDTARLWRVETLDELLERGCEWLHDYLTTNPNATDEDRAMCGIPPREAEEEP